MGLHTCAVQIATAWRALNEDRASRVPVRRALSWRYHTTTTCQEHQGVQVHIGASFVPRANRKAHIPGFRIRTGNEPAVTEPTP